MCYSPLDTYFTFLVLQELTGDLPWETPLAPREPLPTVPRRMGTGFSLRREVIRSADGDDDDQVRFISTLAVALDEEKNIYAVAT